MTLVPSPWFLQLVLGSTCYSMWVLCFVLSFCPLTQFATVCRASVCCLCCVIFVVHCGTSVFCLCYVIFLFSQRAHVHASIRTDTHTHTRTHTHTHVHPFSSFNCHKCVDQSDMNGSTCCSILMFVAKCIDGIVSCILSLKWGSRQILEVVAPYAQAVSGSALCTLCTWWSCSTKLKFI